MTEDNLNEVQEVAIGETPVISEADKPKSFSYQSMVDFEDAVKLALENYFNANEGVSYQITMPVVLDIFLRFPTIWLIEVFGRSYDDLRKVINGQLDSLVERIESVKNKQSTEMNIKEGTLENE